MSQGKLTAALLFAVVPTVFAGCVEMEGEELDVGTEAQELLGCPHWGCDANSPVIDVWDFHDLHELGLPNDAGVVVNGLWKAGDEYRPRVVGAKLYGYPLNPALPVLQGVALENAYFDVTTTKDNKNWKIEIRNVSNVVHYWINPTTPNETYELFYTGNGYDRPLCKNPPGRVDGEGRIWGKQYEAILYTGDRYKADNFTVIGTDVRSTQGWFNIGCAGGALAKLHLNRHTTAGSTSLNTSGWQQRQAMLKMYAADVCGQGVSSTQQGEPLRWTNQPGWVPLGAISSYEAIWNENGAVCLDHHRLENSSIWTTLNIEDQIKASCPGGVLPPPCNLVPGSPISWPAGTYLVTGNP